MQTLRYQVDYMPYYAASLTQAIQQATSSSGTCIEKPLEGLKIVLNSGNGSGAFFYDVLKNLGADVSASIRVEHDSTFPRGVPNPESNAMVKETIRVCHETHADLGIMLDTDADRSGFIVPGVTSYEPLNRNRLIALLGVIFSESSPGCTFVTDSVTSEGLEEFLQNKLGLVHVRYLKGYANVIGKAREITDSGAANAEVAIETSGHCAMRENDYLDDGTYTAVKVIALLAKVKQNSGHLLDLIADLEEMPETQEFRLLVNDGTLETTGVIFDELTSKLEVFCQGNLHWTIDTANLEGIRIRTGTDGGFFMLRKSLHDPLVSVQVEGESAEQIRTVVVRPLLTLLESEQRLLSSLDVSVLSNY
jgi:phosphomannomutase